jgi:hypothetical protein
VNFPINLAELFCVIKGVIILLPVLKKKAFLNLYKFSSTSFTLELAFTKFISFIVILIFCLLLVNNFKLFAILLDIFVNSIFFNFSVSFFSLEFLHSAAVCKYLFLIGSFFNDFWLFTYSEIFSVDSLMSLFLVLAVLTYKLIIKY